MKKILLAILVAAFTSVGVIIPDKYLDAFVTFFMPKAYAHDTVLHTETWPCVPYNFKVDWYEQRIKCYAPESKLTIAEALRPSSAHFSTDLVTRTSSDKS